jgi:hypothetical protein
MHGCLTAAADVDVCLAMALVGYDGLARISSCLRGWEETAIPALMEKERRVGMNYVKRTHFTNRDIVIARLVNRI